MSLKSTSMRDAPRTCPGNDHVSRPAPRQRGAALLGLLGLILLAAIIALVGRFDSQASIGTLSKSSDGKALADAKAALIAWSATYTPSAAQFSTIGNLPYPDRDGDGRYDGFADCDALGVNDLALVGRLPQLGEDSVSSLCGVDNPLNVELHDSAGEPLWYAVSRNVLSLGGAGGPVNPDMGGAGRMIYPWITLRDDQGNIVLDPNTGGPLAVAAVIFAPGAALPGQDRSGAAPAPANYLDTITIGATTYDNADADGCPDNTVAPCGSAGEEFVVFANPQSGANFNDRLAYITVDELMRAAEKRVLGEVAATLNAYRATYNAYPWLADFRNPRAVASGAADSGSSAHLDQAAGNFLAKNVQVGDTIVNLDDGSSGPITGVTATRIDFDALQGGAENDVDAGESFEVWPSFKSTLSRRGQLAVHTPNEIFNTSFVATWNFDDIDDYYESGDPALRAFDSEFESNSVAFTSSEGICMWTHADRADCYGIQVIGDGVTPFVIPSGYTVDRRTIEVQFSFDATVGGAPASAVVTAPTATDPRRRSVTIFSDPGVPDPPIPEPSRYLAASPPELDFAPFLPRDRDSTPGDDETWVVRITDELAGSSGQKAVVIDADTRGTITVAGIRFDLSVVYDDTDDARDELPEWLVENNWHHFILATFAGDFMAGGDADCVTSTSCLTLNVAGVDTLIPVEGLLLSAGVEWTNQDRTIGDCDGDGGGPLAEPTDDSFLCAYFDSLDTSTYDVSTDLLRHGQNTQAINLDFYAREVFSNTYNDQVRVVAPLPP